MSSKAFVTLTPLLAALGALAAVPAPTSAAEPSGLYAVKAAALERPQFAEIFSEHAVLQRDVVLPLWGTAKPGARLKVTVADQTLTAQADSRGRWRVEAAPLRAGGPYALKVADAEGQGEAFLDILAGDVWLCSGQSNMELATGSATNAWNEVRASTNTNLRFVNIARDARPLRQDRLLTTGQWEVASIYTTGASSAVCYYMSKALQAAEHVPVGFINVSWGGTPIQAWISEPALRRFKTYDAGLDLLANHAASPTGAATASPPWKAESGLSVLFNGMIAPITPYRIKGVAWYQGEANWKDAEQYKALLTGLIADWRQAFGQEKLPFLVVQLPAYGAPAVKPGESAWPILREAERKAVLETPATGLAVSVDVGDRFDIHPAQKSVVGQRLALSARRLVYGEVVPASPSPLRVERKDDDLIITFADADGGLKTYSSDRAIGFEACDATKACRWVEAIPEGDTVRLKGAGGPEARYVRYAWADAPFVNLFSAADLPVAPFELTVP